MPGAGPVPGPLPGMDEAKEVGTVAFCLKSRPCRVLVVEPVPGLQYLMTLLLEEEDCTVTMVATLDGAMAELATAAFDVVLTDSFSLKPQDVYLSIRGLLRAAGKTPVVLCTAHRLAPKELSAAGVHVVIPKPFDIDFFAARVKQACSASRAAADSPRSPEWLQSWAPPSSNDLPRRNWEGAE
jgi:CheY-like chemotaxis protein